MCYIDFIDDTRVDITAHSRLIIDDFVYDPNTGKGSLGLKASLGTIRYASGQIAKNSRQRVRIRTPSATISVRGTDFAMVIDPDPAEYFKDFKEAPLKLILDKDESCLMLCTSKDQIQKLIDIGRSKEGLCARVNGLDVFLQVDLRADSRPRQKA